MKSKYGSIVSFVWKESPRLFLATTLCSVLSGGLYAILFPLVLSAFDHKYTAPSLSLDRDAFNFFNSPNSKAAVIFLTVCCIVFASRYIANIGNCYLVLRAAKELRRQLYSRIRRSYIRDLDAIGFTKLMTCVNTDIGNMAQGVIVLPQILASLSSILAVLIYILLLNVNVFLFVMFFLLVATMIHSLLLRIGQQYLMQGRQAFDDVQEGFRGLFFGSKELKLNQRKSDFHHSQKLNLNEVVSLSKSLRGGAFICFGWSFGEISHLALLGLAAFHLKYTYYLGDSESLGAVFALFYLAGPITSVMTSLDHVARATISSFKVDEVMERLNPEQFLENHFELPKWDAIGLKNVSYKYNKGDVEPVLKDINLRLKKGEITFLTGGNGSGKSTLAKILSFHFVPTAGTVNFGNTPIGADNIYRARDLVSAIYTDFYLFDRIYGFTDDKLEQCRNYLSLMRLNDKVSISEHGVYSTTNLSDGQRKRLAMITVLLEDRKVLVFDEWAADQDPEFKEVFYRKMLPDMKTADRVVIVVTHDDSYFEVADQLVKLQSGTIKTVVTKTS